MSAGFASSSSNPSTPLLVHDEHGNILDANSEASRSLGYSQEEMLRLCVRDFATNLVPENERAPDDKKTLWQLVMEADPGETVGYHHGEHRRKDGTTFPVEVRLGGRRAGRRETGSSPQPEI